MVSSKWDTFPLSIYLYIGLIRILLHKLCFALEHPAFNNLLQDTYFFTFWFGTRWQGESCGELSMASFNPLTLSSSAMVVERQKGPDPDQGVGKVG